VASFDKKGEYIFTGNAKGKVNCCFEIKLCAAKKLERYKLQNKLISLH